MFVGNALLTLDLIIINHFISRLQSDNLLLELSLRDQVRENLIFGSSCLLKTPLSIWYMEYTEFPSKRNTSVFLYF